MINHMKGLFSCKMERKELKKYLIIAVIIIGICAVVKNFSLLGIIIGLIFTALYPLILGAAIAFVFNISPVLMVEPSIPPMEQIILCTN